MRLAGRVALGLVGLALVGSLALVVALPRLVELSGVRERLVDWTQTRFGRSVSYEAFSVGFFPPRIEVTDLVVGAALEAGAPAFRAPSMSLALAWRRLLTGSVEIDSVVIEGADLRFVRTAEGVDWLAAGVPALPAASAIPASEAASALPVGFRRLALRGSRVAWVDTLVDSALTLQVDDVELVVVAEGDSAARVRLNAAGRLPNGGAVEARGLLAASGEVAIEVGVSRLDLAPWSRYFESVERASGSGLVALQIESAGRGPVQLALSVVSDDLEAAGADAIATGAVELSAQLEWRDDRLEGPYTVDLTGALLEVASGLIRKEPGQPGRLTGEVQLDQEGARSDFHLELRNLRAEGAYRSSPALTLELAAEPFDLLGWETTAPGLGPVVRGGRLAISKLRFRGEPARVTGRVELDRLVVAPQEDAEGVELSGVIEADGRDIKLRDGEVAVGTARVGLEASIADLFGGGAGRLRLWTRGAVESNAFFSQVEGLRGSIHGPLTFNLELRAPDADLSQEAAWLDRLRGGFRFSIGAGGVGGRLEGVSFLERVVTQLGALGQFALRALPARRGQSMEAYYSDSFREAKGSFQIADGWAQTDDTEWIHDRYVARLRGGLRLSDLALDMRGTLVLGPELDALLSGVKPGQARSIPLVRVGGTLTDPTIALRDADVSRFLAHYALGEQGALGRKLDKVLGAGTSRLLRDIIDKTRP